MLRKLMRNLRQTRAPQRFLGGVQLQQAVQQYFNGKDRYIRLYERYRKPLYVLETEVLRQRAGEFRAAFSSCMESTGYYFAVKSNNHPAVAQTLLREGYGLDVSSGLELETALTLGADDLVFSGPGKTEAELSLALAHHDKVTLLADSLREVEKTSRLALANGIMAKVGIRLATSGEALWRKFGIAPETLPHFWQVARELPAVDLCGIQFHSSWNLSADAQVNFIRRLGNILRSMPEAFLGRLKFIDIGGGYWPPQGEWLQRSATITGRAAQLFGDIGVNAARRHYIGPAETIREFAGEIAHAMQQHIFPLVQCRVWFEPGRWICNDAMHLIMGVVEKKDADLVITDAGIHAIGWDRFESDYFPVLNLSRPALDEKPCNILGCLCTPRDVFGYGYWGSDIQEGDILMVPMQGAYTYSLRQNFIKPLPEVVIL